MGEFQREGRAQSGLVRGRQVLSAGNYPPLQLRLGITRPFRVWMGLRVGSDERVRPQRLHGSQEPCLVFPVWQNHFARQAASRCHGPSLHLGAEFFGTVFVAIEYDEDRLAAGLTARDLYGPHHATFAYQLSAGPANGCPNPHRPSAGFGAQTS